VIILVIDDDDMFREFLGETLTASGHEPLLAADGVSALAMLRLRDAAVGAVLLDANLQGMSCRDTLLELARLHPGVPVAMISGEAVGELQHRFAGLPVSGFLAKPFKDAELTALIGALARGQVATAPEPAVRASREPSVSRVPGPRA
jgi:DNA-binding response OmpR family regulator